MRVHLYECMQPELEFSVFLSDQSKVKNSGFEFPPRDWPILA